MSSQENNQDDNIPKQIMLLKIADTLQSLKKTVLGLTEIPSVTIEDSMSDIQSVYEYITQLYAHANAAKQEDLVKEFMVNRCMNLPEEEANNMMLKMIQQLCQKNEAKNAE